MHLPTVGTTTWYGKRVTGTLRAGNSLGRPVTRRPICGHSDDLFQREVNRVDELHAKPGALALVPKGGVFKFGGGFGFGAEPYRSSLGQPLDNARAHVLPRFTGRFAVHHTSCPSFDFMGPRGFDFCRILCRRLVEAGQQFSGHVGRVLQRATSRLLEEVLALGTSCSHSRPGRAAQQAAAPDGCVLFVQPLVSRDR